MKTLTFEPSMVTMASPKKMAPFSNNMHYKTNFTIGIPGLTYTSKTDVIPVPIYQPNKEKDITDNYDQQSYVSLPAQSAKIEKLEPKYEIIQPNIPHIELEKRMVETGVGEEPVIEKVKEAPIAKRIEYTPVKKLEPKKRESFILNEEVHSTERYSTMENHMKDRKGSMPTSLMDMSPTGKKDQIGMFLPSQYENAEAKRKEKMDTYVRDLTNIKIRKMQERQEEENKERQRQVRLDKEWEHIGSKEEYETYQYKSHLEKSHKMDEYGYELYKKNESSPEKKPNILHEPREKLNKDFTGKDIIRKMQHNWYKELVKEHGDSMFQGVGKQVLK